MRMFHLFEGTELADSSGSYEILVLHGIHI